ncbi:MAG: GTPase HflX [Lachnospira sp.]|jgi:GTP-binding protein HflX|nr:GTPase HflX [Lachnospira sp.]
MGKVLSTQDIVEKVILVGVWLDNGEDEESLLDELEELVKTAGGVVVGRIIQSRDQFHPATYIGKGKLDEIRILIDELDATGIVCDDELSPAQLKNLEDELNTKVMDRTMVILDIFAARANTSEGKIQVEMAQLKYRMTRLSGFGKALSRLGGGIGTRGPGEKKIETDRRIIRERISRLSVQLKEIEQHRQTIRKKRKNISIPIAAIVGYTNAGKSTLLNKLTDAGVLSEDKLFATLDPTTRALIIPDGEKVLLTDTVGFIRKLPHHLIEAFKSTLQEAKFADIIIHVVDSSNPDMDKHIKTVYEILESLEVGDKPIITLYNKSDLVQGSICGIDTKAKQTIKVSAKTGEGLDVFLKELQYIIRDGYQKIEQLFAYSDAGKIQDIREYGKILKEEYREDGIYVEALMPKQY